MRIALSHHKLCERGGIEGYVWEVARRLASAGHEVHAFVQAARGGAPAGVRVRRLARPPLPRALDILWFARASHRAIAAERWDVVHGFSTGYWQDVYTEGSGAYRDFLARTLPARRGRVRRLLRRHGPRRRAVEWVEARRYGPAGARRVLAMSAFCRDSVVARYPGVAGRMEVLAPGVDLERFGGGAAAGERARIRGLCGVRDDETALLLVGNDWERKGAATLARAVAALRAGGAAVRGVVVGAERPGRARRLRAEAGDGVAFVGPQEDTAPWFAAADVFVFPTRFDAFGLVVLEAMAAGLPAIVSARAGASECVRPGETGAVLADPEDSEGLAALVRPYLDAGLRARHGAAARREAAGHGWDAHFRRLLEVYEEISGGVKPS